MGGTDSSKKNQSGIAGKQGGNLTYRKAGVDIDEGNALIQKIKPFVEQTRRQEVLSSIGGFAGLFSVPGGFSEPVLVSGTDGVGTKLKVAFSTERHDTVGIDLVAMCVNDVAVTGAEPLFFLDYFAAGKLDVSVAERVITGIAAGCRLSGCTLLGGETAEMPGFYPDGEYDLSGFCVGIVEKSKIITGELIKEGDVLIGVASSGLHSNGFSLARKALFDELGYGLDDTPGEISRPLGLELMEPTRIYVKVLREAINIGGLKAASHITGGGLVENPVRCLPKNKKLSVRLHRGSWPILPIFQTIATAGVAEEEMYRTFNMGLGLVLFVDKNKAKSMIRALNGAGELAWPVGEVVEDSKTPMKVFFD